MFYKQPSLNSVVFALPCVMDLLLINGLANYLPINFDNPWLFHAYLSLGWITISIKNNFYKVYRYVKVPYLLRLIFIQFVFFFLVLYAFIGFFKQPGISRLTLAEFFLLTAISISFLKILVYSLQLQYGTLIKSSIRRVLVIGKNNKTDQIITVFKDRKEYGFEFVRRMDPRSSEFDIEECKDFIQKEGIDEIYCSISGLENKEIETLINFADNNLKTLKFIPDNKNIFSKKLKFEYYDYVPILSLRDIPLHNPINAFLKRSFDVVFSLLVILGLLSWLTPILALIISLESKGPVFFRQKRNGIDNREFYCYKFRSMTPNANADTSSATKNDMRVTRIGKIIRRTSIDELPQFYNVFFGSMSVVGPRPHMVKHTSEYADRIDKFMVRHFVKPGITGLAQVRGFRGEIEKDSDIQNRIKFDIFYIENWSMFLDLKIIVQTVLNIFRKEDKAY